ncbi:MAG: GcrA family cell cycle regulator [Hyphomicrobiaceae bacterium]
MIEKAKQLKVMETLEASDCRWPIGDPRHPGFHFCGARQAAGRPYCIEHWQLSFVPSRPRHQAAAPSLPVVAALPVPRAA